MFIVNSKAVITNLCSRLYSIESEYLKNKQIAFEPPFGGLSGNVRTPSIARWKARGRLPIRHNGTFSLSPTAHTLQAEICRSRRFSKWYFAIT